MIFSSESYSTFPVGGESTTGLPWQLGFCRQIRGAAMAAALLSTQTHLTWALRLDLPDLLNQSSPFRQSPSGSVSRTTPW